MGLRSRGHKGYSVIGDGRIRGWKSGICDGGATDLPHRLGARVPFVCGAAVSLEALSYTRGEGGASELGRVRRGRVIVVGMDRL